MIYSQHSLLSFLHFLPVTERRLVGRILVEQRRLGIQLSSRMFANNPKGQLRVSVVARRLIKITSLFSHQNWSPSTFYSCLSLLIGHFFPFTEEKPDSSLKLISSRSSDDRVKAMSRQLFREVVQLLSLDEWRYANHRQSNLPISTIGGAERGGCLLFVVVCKHAMEAHLLFATSSPLTRPYPLIRAFPQHEAHPAVEVLVFVQAPSCLPHAPLLVLLLQLIILRLSALFVISQLVDAGWPCSRRFSVSRVQPTKSIRWRSSGARLSDRGRDYGMRRTVYASCQCELCAVVGHLCESILLDLAEQRRKLQRISFY